MPLSAREQRQLDAIGTAISRSDAELASMLAVFAWLAADEPMPGREQLTKPACRIGQTYRTLSAVLRGFITWLNCVNIPPPSPAAPGIAAHPA